jgi:hypothetical protein
MGEILTCAEPTDLGCNYVTTDVSLAERINNGNGWLEFSLLVSNSDILPS